MKIIAIAIKNLALYFLGAIFLASFFTQIKDYSENIFVLAAISWSAYISTKLLIEIISELENKKII